MNIDLHDFFSATLIHDNQIKPVHYLVKHETALRPQEDDFHPIVSRTREET